MSKFAKDLDWNLLHSFLVVCQEKNMTRAAEVLHRTQPAVSQAIKRLEEAAGIKLLERSKSGLIPTDAGQDLLRQVRPIYAAISRMPLVLSQAPSAMFGKIVIATIDKVDCPELDRVIAEFFDEFPRVDLEIEVATTEAVLRSVRLGAATVGLSDGVIPHDLKRRDLLEEKFGLYCGNNHEFAGQTEISEQDLRAQPFVNFTADVLGGKHMGDIAAYRAKASIGQRVRGQSTYVDQVAKMIELGVGIGFLPIHLAEPFVDARRLWRLPPYEDEPTATVYLVANPTVHHSDAEQRFLERIAGIKINQDR